MRGGLCLASWAILVTMLPISVSVYPDSAEMLYQEGLYKEKTVGDLEAAIEVYKKALLENAKNEEFAAKAQLRIGVCYDLLGKDEEALEAYMKVISDFPDQKEARNEALQRLAARGEKDMGEAFDKLVSNEPLRLLQTEIERIQAIREEAEKYLQRLEHETKRIDKEAKFRETVLTEKVESQERQEALRKIERFFIEAESNDGAIAEIARLVPKAEHNIPVLVHTAYLAWRFRYNTSPLMDIARLAASCDRECEELYELAELDVLKLSESTKLVQLAESVVKAQSEEEKKQVRQEIEEFRATADYKSFEEALKGQTFREEVVYREKIESQEKWEALRKIERFYIEAKFHNIAILDIARLVPKAEHNIPVITHIAYLASKFGYSTLPLAKIAQLASLCDRDCGELLDIADLVVLNLSGTRKVVQLAESAVKAQSEEEKKQVGQEIEKLRATADYRSIEEAVDSQIFGVLVRSQEKQEALRAIEGFYNEAKFNQGAIADIAYLVPKAEHNIAVIVHTAYIASKFGYHTAPLVDIARLAGSCDRECKELYDLAELTVLNRGGSPVVQVAELAIKAQNEEDKKQVKQGIEELRAKADYGSIEEALEAQRKRESR